jgi:hypothetical protein
MWAGGLSKQYAITTPFKSVLIVSATRVTNHPDSTIEEGKFAVTSKFLKTKIESNKYPPEII